MTHLLRIMTGICLLLASVQALANTALTALDFRQGQGGELQVDLTFSQGVLEVRGYRLDEPARLSIDLIDATNQLEQRRIDLGIGGVEQVTALEAGSAPAWSSTSTARCPMTPCSRAISCALPLAAPLWALPQRRASSPLPRVWRCRQARRCRR